MRIDARAREETLEGLHFGLRHEVGVDDVEDVLDVAVNADAL